MNDVRLAMQVGRVLGEDETSDVVCKAGGSVRALPGGGLCAV